MVLHGIRLHPYSALLCTKFQGNWIIAFVSYDNFHTLTNRKQTKKLSQFSKVYISEKFGMIYLKFRMWGPEFLPWILSGFVKVSRSCAYIKMHYLNLFFFLLITHGHGAQASWATWHITMWIDGIVTKFDIRMWLYAAFLCALFQDNGITYSQFFLQLLHFDEKRGKWKWRNSAKLWRFISWKLLRQFSFKKFRMWGADVGRHFHCKNHLGWLKYSIMELSMRENCISDLPVNNSWMWCAGFLGCMTHYCVSWQAILHCFMAVASFLQSW